MTNDIETIETALFGREVSFEFDAPWATYWLVLVRLVMGWWFLGAGLSKVVEYGVLYDAEGWLLYGTEGTIVHGFTSWFAVNAVWLPNLLVPWGQIAIGLGLMLGVLTRLAAFNGALLMLFFYLGGAGWENGFVTGELLGLLLYGVIIAVGAGRAFGVDGVLEQTEYVRQRPWLRYLMG